MFVNFSGSLGSKAPDTIVFLILTFKVLDQYQFVFFFEIICLQFFVFSNFCYHFPIEIKTWFKDKNLVLN